MENIEVIIESLEKSKTEEDILENLTKLVKGFSHNQYKERIISNPYFKSLIPDIKREVSKEIFFYRESINQEISEIDSELKNPDNKHTDKLKSLRRDCVSLLYELDQKEKELGQL